MEELLSDKTIENKIKLDERNIILYDRVRDTYSLLGIMKYLGIIKEIRSNMQENNIPELFKEWFGENIMLYQSLRSVVRRLDKFYYERIKRDIDKNIKQKIL